MGVETRRDDDQFRFEAVDRRDDPVPERLPQFVTAVARAQRCVENVADARLIGCTGAGNSGI